MKKTILFLAAVLTLSCSSDNNTADQNTSTSFNFDGTEYQLLGNAGMSEIVMSGLTDFNDETYDRSTISVSGMNGMSSTATVAFDLYYKSGTSVEGTYNIYDNEADANGNVEDFFLGQERGCMGGTSAGTVFSMGSNNMTSGNNPTGTVEIIVNSANNYTLIYNGNFRQYEDFNFIRNLPTAIDITSDVIRQEM